MWWALGSWERAARAMPGGDFAADAPPNPFGILDTRALETHVRQAQPVPLRNPIVHQALTVHAAAWTAGPDLTPGEAAEALDLLSLATRWDWRQRPTAAELLQHPFLRDALVADDLSSDCSAAGGEAMDLAADHPPGSPPTDANALSDADAFAEAI